jgi:hypothetical protein
LKLSINQLGNKEKSMQIAQEMMVHFGDAKSSFTAASRYRFPIWLVALITLIACVMGAYTGWVRGLSDGSELSDDMNVSLALLSAEARASDKPYLAEKILLRAIDRQVSNYYEDKESTMRNKVWLALSPLRWGLWPVKGGYEQNKLNFLKRNAELRLKYVPTPRAETWAEIKALGFEGWQAKRDWFIKTAVHYSKLLGREVTVDQLFPDAYLREDIINIRAAREEAAKAKG